MTAAHTEWTPTEHDLQPLNGPIAIDGDRDQARVTTRIAVAASLKLQSLSWQEVADRTGYSSRGAAYSAVMPFLRRVRDENISDLREQESARLDRSAAAIWAKVLQGDARAQDTWLRNRQAFRRLHGLDAPVQVAISMGVQAEVEDALAELEEYLAARRLTVPGEVVDEQADPDEEERHG